jgi:hypothetical protein
MLERIQDQLKTQYIIQNDTGCWVWQGQLSNSGRGRIKVNNEQGKTIMVSAEDASYMAYIGEIPDKHLVVQSCGNRLCINPEHLALTRLP